ncbi:MAG: acyl carrier protein [bacterium]|nr:acyl carrier protein [bacterium]
MADQQQIIEAIAENLTLPVADIDMEASLQDDMGLNPVEVADLLADLAHRFKIVFEPGEVEHIKTIGDVVELIEDKSLE